MDPDGRDVIFAPVTTSYDGPANPVYTGDIAETQPSLQWKINEVTNKYDLYVMQNISYTSAFNNVGANGKTLEQENPGVFLLMQTHEGSHVDANTVAYNSTISLTINSINGSNQTFTGKGDEVANQAFDALQKQVEAQFNQAEADIKAQYSPLLEKADGDLYKKMKDERDAKISDARMNIEIEQMAKLKPILSQIEDKLEEVKRTLNIHEGPNGINQQTANNLPAGSSSRDMQLGIKPITHQGEKVVNGRRNGAPEN